jgi:hypothetical protein
MTNSHRAHIVRVNERSVPLRVRAIVLAQLCICGETATPCRPNTPSGSSPSHAPSGARLTRARAPSPLSRHRTTRPHTFIHSAVFSARPRTIAHAHAPIARNLQLTRGREAPGRAVDVVASARASSSDIDAARTGTAGNPAGGVFNCKSFPAQRHTFSSFARGSRSETLSAWLGLRAGGGGRDAGVVTGVAVFWNLDVASVSDVLSQGARTHVLEAVRASRAMCMVGLGPGRRGWLWMGAERL